MDQWEYASKVYPCPIAMTADLLNSRWRTNVLWFVWKGIGRVEAIRRELPEVGSGVLKRVLRELEDDGLIVRRERTEPPASVEYVLSEVGLSLASVLEPMAVWGQTYGKRIWTPRRIAES